MQKAGHVFEWADIKRDLETLQDITIKESGRKLSVLHALSFPWSGFLLTSSRKSMSVGLVSFGFGLAMSFFVFASAFCASFIASNRAFVRLIPFAVKSYLHND